MTKEIIDQIVNKTGWNFKGHVFDMYKPYDISELNSESGVFTFGAMEQLGNKFYPFTEYLLSKKPKIIINVETTIELYDENNLVDYLALKYDKKRRNVKLLDIVEFKDRGSKRTFIAKITELSYFNNFKEAIEGAGIKKVLPNAGSLKDGVEIYESLPHGEGGTFKAGAIKYGVLRMKFELMV